MTLAKRHLKPEQLNTNFADPSLKLHTFVCSKAEAFFIFSSFALLTMFRHSLNIDLRRKDKARPAMFLLLALFLLSACPVKRAIHFLLFDKGIENADLTKKAPLSGDFLAAGSETCSLTDQSTARVDISSQASQSLFPIGLAFFFLLPAFSLKDLLTKGLSYYSQVTSVKGLAPIYLRNRRLLI